MIDDVELWLAWENAKYYFANIEYFNNKFNGEER